MQVRDIGRDTAADLRVLRAALSSWRAPPGAVLMIGIDANAGERSRADVLAFMQEIGEVVEQSCELEQPILKAGTSRAHANDTLQVVLTSL